MKLDFFAHPTPSRSLAINSQQLVNWFPTIDESSRGKVSLYPTPGLLRRLTVTAGEGRGMLAANDLLYVVVGDTLWEISTAHAATSRGTLSSTVGRVSMADNGLQLMIVDGGSGYIYTYATATFAQIADLDFPGADVVVYKDTYFAFNIPDTNQWGITASFDGSSIDPLEFAASEDSPDNVVSLLQQRSEIWIFNETSIEVDYNSGDVFPFARINGATMDVGCAAAHSVARSEGFVGWLGQDRSGQRHVYAASGYSPQPISDQYLDKAIGGYSDISDAFSFVYEQDGHKFYVLTFPTGNATYVYDMVTKLWHQRSSFGIGRWRVAAHAFFNERNYVLDYANGDIYELDLDTYLEDDATIRREAISQHLHSDGKSVFYPELQVFFEHGVGLTTGQGSDPQAMLQWSDDGGFTWSSEHWRSIGAIGEYRDRAVWRKMGRARDRVYKLAFTDPVRCVVIDTNLTGNPANH